MKSQTFIGDGNDMYSLKVVVESKTAYPSWRVDCTIKIYLRYHYRNLPHTSNIDIFVNIKANEYEDSKDVNFTNNEYVLIETFEGSMWYDDEGQFTDVLNVNIQPNDSSTLLSLKEPITLDPLPDQIGRAHV